MADSGFNTFFSLFWVLFAGVILYAIWKWYSQWSWNNRQPILTVPVTVVTKRDKATHRSSMHHHNHHHFSDSTRHEYFITFEFQSRSRVELSVDESEYGLIAENDKGMLTFQGTRFLGFVRA